MGSGQMRGVRTLVAKAGHLCVLPSRIARGCIWEVHASRGMQRHWPVIKSSSIGEYSQLLITWIGSTDTSDPRIHS